MAFHVEIRDSVVDYLEAIECLTDGDRAAIIEGMIEELSRDAIRLHALHPLGHESLLFHYDYPHPTQQTLYNLDFVVDAAHLDVGVVRVIYVECSTEPMQG